MRQHPRLRAMLHRAALPTRALRGPSLLRQRSLRCRRDVRLVPGRLRVRPWPVRDGRLLHAELCWEGLRRRWLRGDLRRCLRLGLPMRRRQVRGDAVVREWHLRPDDEGELQLMPQRLRLQGRRQVHELGVLPPGLHRKDLRQRWLRGKLRYVPVGLVVPRGSMPVRCFLRQHEMRSDRELPQLPARLRVRDRPAVHVGRNVLLPAVHGKRLR